MSVMESGLESVQDGVPEWAPAQEAALAAASIAKGCAATSPQLISQVRPTYTAGALDQRIQGSVELGLVVTTEGAPSAIRVVRLLGPAGLDEELSKPSDSGSSNRAASPESQ